MSEFISMWWWPLGMPLAFVAAAVIDRGEDEVAERAFHAVMLCLMWPLAVVVCVVIAVGYLLGRVSKMIAP